MNQSEKINDLATALCACQAELTFAVKDSNNPFHKSKYADLSSVWDSIRIPMTKNGLSVTQTVDIIGDRIVLTSILMHKSGQWIKSHVPVINSNNTCQGQGAGITYARRYGLASIIGCVQDDDDGEAAMPKDRGKKSSSDKSQDDPIIDKNNAETLKKLSENCDPEYMKNIHNHMKTKGCSGFEELKTSLYNVILKGMLKNASEYSSNEKLVS